jgi:hypothetical protein
MAVRSGRTAALTAKSAGALALGLGLVMATCFGAASASGATPASASKSTLRGPTILGWGIERPQGVATNGTDVWAPSGANSVIEVKAKTGALVRVISGASYRFNEPDAVAVDGTDVFVANYQGKSVTEFSASTGALVRVISDPLGIAVDRSDAFVANFDGNSVTEFGTTGGALVRVIRGSAYEFDNPDALATDPLRRLLCLHGEGHRTVRGEHGGPVGHRLSRRLKPAGSGYSGTPILPSHAAGQPAGRAMRLSS